MSFRRTLLVSLFALGIALVSTPSAEAQQQARATEKPSVTGKVNAALREGAQRLRGATEGLRNRVARGLGGEHQTRLHRDWNGKTGSRKGLTAALRERLGRILRETVQAIGIGGQTRGLRRRADRIGTAAEQLTARVQARLEGKTMRERQSALRETRAELKETYDKLSDRVDKLDPDTDVAGEMQRELGSIGRELDDVRGQELELRFRTKGLDGVRNRVGVGTSRERLLEEQTQLGVKQEELRDKFANFQRRLDGKLDLQKDKQQYRKEIREQRDPLRSRQHALNGLIGALKQKLSRSDIEGNAVAQLNETYRSLKAAVQQAQDKEVDLRRYMEAPKGPPATELRQQQRELTRTQRALRERLEAFGDRIDRTERQQKAIKEENAQPQRYHR